MSTKKATVSRLIPCTEDIVSVMKGVEELGQIMDKIRRYGAAAGDHRIVDDLASVLIRSWGYCVCTGQDPARTSAIEGVKL